MFKHSLIPVQADCVQVTEQPPANIQLIRDTLGICKASVFKNDK